MVPHIDGGSFSAKRLFRLTVSTLLIPVLAGCATPVVKTGPIFFPPSPDPPRVQFLTKINGSADIEGKKSSFSLLVTGKEEEDSAVAIYKPYGVTGHEGKIYVSDLGGRIIVIDPVHKKVESLGGGQKMKGMKKPLNVDFDEAGNLYVADAQLKEILVFNPNGDTVRSIGRGELNKPTDVIVDAGLLMVLDLGTNAIKMFDLKTGELVRTVDQKSEGGKALQAPTAFTKTPQGELYLTNLVGSNVVKIDRDGHFLSTFGKLGDGYGDFARPKGVAVDAEGRIYVVDNGMQRVNIFNEAGKLLLVFGDPGLPEGSLNLPIGITVMKGIAPFFQQFVDPSFEVEYLIFVTNQFGTAKVSVYGLGHRKEGFGDKTKIADTKPSGSREPEKK